ncbi:prepilin-type N-terminal cleavage/methylation domain-containing protein [Candidatus Saccharibacteria bacterium]|nr:MAG: prepilin-type N-terminal cleavage/methylation domain-containing protein [Candidatus Saccharibacteria bacterium]
MHVINRLMATRFHTTNQRGDTIVEVLIAIALVSLVLTSAYALTNKNVRATQEVQEQSYAQKLAEQQVELLRASNPKPTASSCFDPNTGATLALISVACRPTVGNVNYSIEVARDSVVPEKYSVRVTWDTLSGRTAKVTVYYKVAP